MRRLTVFRALSGAAPFAVVLALGACGQTPPPDPSGASRYIATTGLGEVSAAPDRAEIRIGVENEAESAAEALRLNGDAMTAVLDSVAALGLDPNADARTLQVSVRPRYEQVATTVGGPRRRTLVGYTAVNSVVVTVRDVAQASKVLDQVTGAGANRTDSIVFLLAERSALEDQARTAAWADARRKAELLAAEAGMTLGAVRAIVERRPEPRGPRERRPRLDARAAGSPLAPGERTVRVTLNVEWDLAPGR